jgi:hypothetical protein
MKKLCAAISKADFEYLKAHQQEMMEVPDLVAKLGRTLKDTKAQGACGFTV